MFDEIQKKLTLILGAKDDGATAQMDRMIGKGNDLERALKKIGKISGIGGFGGASDVAEGFSGKLGILGRAAGGIAAVEGIGRGMKLVGDTLNEAIDKGEGFSVTLDKIGSKIPLIGSVKNGFESLTSGIAKATAAAIGFDTATAGRRGKLAGKALSIFGMPEALSGAVDELSGTADNKAEGEALDARTKIIRKQIEDNKKDREESARIARQAMDDRERIETERTEKLDAIMERRRIWAVRNGGLSVEAEKQFATDEQTTRAEADKKLADLVEHGNQLIKKATDDRLKMLQDEQEETAKIFRGSERSRAGLVGELMEGPSGELERLRNRTKETIDDIKLQMQEAAKDPKLTPWGYLNRITALSWSGLTEQNNSTARQTAIIDRSIKETTEQIAAARLAQQDAARQREDASRIRAFETQQGPRTSNFDGRGQTGFFNQSKSIEDSGKKTAENTKTIADTMKTVSDNIGKLFTSGALLSL